MHRPKQAAKQQQQGRPKHLPHCKYYQGEPPANAAIFDVKNQQDEAQTEAEARRSRLQLQRLPALTIRRQLQVQWGPTVSLPQPGESPPPGPPPGHNVRLFEVRHGDAQAAASVAAAPTFGQTFVVQKQGEARSHQPITGPLKPVDVTPLRELPPEQPAPPQPPPAVPPPPPSEPPSPLPRSGPPRQQTSGVKLPPRGRSGRHAASRTTRGQPLAVTLTSARHVASRGIRGAGGSRPAPTSAPSGYSRAAAPSPRRRSSPRRGSPTRKAPPTVGGGTTAARRPTLGPSVSAPGRDAPQASRWAPARVDVTVTSLPSSVPGGLTPSAHPEVVFRELSAAAEARRIAGIPTAVAGDSPDGPLGAEHEPNVFGEFSAADVERMGLASKAESELDIDADADLWSTAQRIRRQQEVTDIEHRVLDLIGARVVAGLLSMDRKLEMDTWREHRMYQPSLSNEVDEVGEHRVLGEGISMEETEIRTPINYDDYLDPEPAEDEVGPNGREKGGSANGDSLDYEDDFEAEEDEEEEEANHHEARPVIVHQQEKEPENRKLTSVPEIQVDNESLKDAKSGQGIPEVNAAAPGPPTAPSPRRGPRRLGAPRAPGEFPRRRRARSTRGSASPCTGGDPDSRRRQPRH